MKNIDKLIYLIESALNIIAPIIAIIFSVIALTNTQDGVVLNIVFLVLSTLILAASTFLLIKIIKRDNYTHTLANYIVLAMSVMALGCSLWMALDFNVVAVITFIVEAIISSVFKFISVNHNPNAIKYNHVRRNQKLATSHTIQISTEYLVKDSYTPEEAERTLNQLLSIRDQQGFSMEDYELIKAKILKNIKKDD